MSPDIGQNSQYKMCMYCTYRYILHNLARPKILVVQGGWGDEKPGNFQGGDFGGKFCLRYAGSLDPPLINIPILTQSSCFRK